LQKRIRTGHALAPLSVRVGQSLSLKELLDVLDPAEFWQIHRFTIVNVNAIAEVSSDVRRHPVLRLKRRNEALQVSQPFFAHLFRQM
jgi:DNA-binding LytR/AlgR family response regulator